MWDMFYAFGIGISFSVGVVFGAFLSRVATKEGREGLKSESQAWKDYRQETIERMALTALNHSRIADALEVLIEKKGEHNA